jgi:xanthine/uracil permease
MPKDVIQDIWERGTGKEKKMTREMIEQFLQPRIKRNVFQQKMFVWIYLFALAATLVLQGINIVGYQSNPLMLAVQAGLTLIALTFFAYGIHLVQEIRRIDRADESLVALLRRRLRFYRTKYEIWLWMTAGTVLLLIYAVTTMTDNIGGHYRINRPGVFIGTSLAVFFGMYAFSKIAHYPFITELMAFLHDLESQVTEQTVRVRELKKTWRLWAIIFAITGTLLFLWGLLRAIQGVK